QASPGANSVLPVSCSQASAESPSPSVPGHVAAAILPVPAAVVPCRQGDVQHKSPLNCNIAGNIRPQKATPKQRASHNGRGDPPALSHRPKPPGEKDKPPGWKGPPPARPRDG